MGDSRDRRLRRSRGTPRDVIDSKSKLERGAPAGQYGQVTFPGEEAIRAAVLEGMCPCCGLGPYILLARHTNAKHGIGTRELRDLAGLTYTASITPDDHQQKRSALARRLIAEGILTPGRGASTAGTHPSYSKAGKERMDEARRTTRKLRRPCPVCGLPIPDSARAAQRTCGQECAREAMARARRATRRPRPSCAICGGDLPGHAQAKVQTCSKRCGGILAARTRMATGG